MAFGHEHDGRKRRRRRLRGGLALAAAAAGVAWVGWRRRGRPVPPGAAGTAPDLTPGAHPLDVDREPVR